MLDVPLAGVTSNFLDLGGHSLLAMRLANRIRGEFGVEIDVRTIFAAPTPAFLAKLLDAAAAGPVRR